MQDMPLIKHVSPDQPEIDNVSPFHLGNVSSAVRLANCLRNFDLISTPGIAKDKYPKTADLLMIVSGQKDTDLSIL